MPPHVTEHSNSSRYDGIEIIDDRPRRLAGRRHRLRVWDLIFAIRHQTSRRNPPALDYDPIQLNRIIV